MRTAFELSEDKPLPDAPIKAGDTWLVFRLTSRERADKEAFKGDNERRLADALLRQKREEVVTRFVLDLRKKAEKKGSVRINPDAITYSASEETASL